MKFLINLKTDRTEDNLDKFFFKIKNIASNLNSIKIMSIAGNWDYCILLDSDDCQFVIEQIIQAQTLSHAVNHILF